MTTKFKTRPLDDAAREAAPGQFVRLSQGVTHYELAGPEDGPPVTLVHGFSVPSYIWDPTFAALAAAGMRVLRYDLFGRGFSDRPDVRYDRELFDRQLAELLDALNFPRPTGLAGLSMGGPIVAVYAQRRPEQVSRLALLDPAGLALPESLPAKLVKLPVIGDWIMDAIGDKVLLGNLRKDIKDPSQAEAYIERFKQQMQFPGFKRALLSTMRSGVLTNAADAYAAVGKLSIPVLLVWGEEDQVVPYLLSEAMRQLIPQARFHAVPNAGHVPSLERPAVVNPLLISFFRERQEDDDSFN